MRPTPTARHVTAVAVFVLVAAVFGLLAMREYRISEQQAHLATAAAKAHDTDLFPNDPIYGSDDLWQLHTPIFEALLKMVLVPSGYWDLVLPFRLLTGVLSLIYLCGMYALLYQQCRSWSVAAYVALLSVAVLEAIPGLKWGFGSLETTTPETLVLALLPLILMGYLRYERQWRVIGVFGAIGLLGNLDLPTSANLVCVFLTVYLIRGGGRWRTWRTAALGLGAAVLTALPYLGYVLSLRYSAAGGSPAEFGTAEEALAVVGRPLLYPDVLVALLNWRLMALLLVLGVPSVLVLVRVERYRVRHQTMWLWWFVASLVLGFGLQGISQAVFKWADLPPIVTFFDMVKLAMAPLFVLLAQALTNLFRLVAKHRATLRWLAATVLVVYLGPSDNLRVARHAAWDAMTSYMPAGRRPSSVVRHQRRLEQHREMAAIAAWAKLATPIDAMFLTDDVEFRMASRRSILVAAADLWYCYTLTDEQLNDWLNRLQRQGREVLHPPARRASGDQILDMVRAMRDRLAYRQVTEWYVILPVETELPAAEGFQVVDPIQWGRYFRVVRLRLPAMDRPAD